MAKASKTSKFSKGEKYIYINNSKKKLLKNYGALVPLVQASMPLCLGPNRVKVLA